MVVLEVLRGLQDQVLQGGRVKGLWGKGGDRI